MTHGRAMSLTKRSVFLSYLKFHTDAVVLVYKCGRGPNSLYLFAELCDPRCPFHRKGRTSPALYEYNQEVAHTNLCLYPCLELIGWPHQPQGKLGKVSVYSN